MVVRCRWSKDCAPGLGAVFGKLLYQTRFANLMNSDFAAVAVVLWRCVDTVVGTLGAPQGYMDPGHGTHSNDDLIANLFSAVHHALGKESVQQCNSSDAAAAASSAVTTHPYLHQALSSTISKHSETAPLATAAPDDGEVATPVGGAGGGKAVPEVGRSSALDLGLCEADQAFLQAVLTSGAGEGEGGGGGRGVNRQLEDHERALQRVIEVGFVGVDSVGRLFRGS